MCSKNVNRTPARKLAEKNNKDENMHYYKCLGHI